MVFNLHISIILYGWNTDVAHIRYLFSAYILHLVCETKTAQLISTSLLASSFFCVHIVYKVLSAQLDAVFVECIYKYKYIIYYI
jgi:3'-phosphoadenosine 5'-phosphosulfate sulfotransferase (PAPS reductase)/FAD synthetase